MRGGSRLCNNLTPPTHNQFTSAEGRGLEPVAFCNYLSRRGFASKSFDDKSLGRSGCCRSFPVVTRSGGPTQGQNRDRSSGSDVPFALVMSAVGAALFGLNDGGSPSEPNRRRGGRKRSPLSSLPDDESSAATSASTPSESSISTTRRRPILTTPIRHCRASIFAARRGASTNALCSGIPRLCRNGTRRPTRIAGWVIWHGC
jgi:hypothetical protein